MQCGTEARADGTQRAATTTEGGWALAAGEREGVGRRWVVKERSATSVFRRRAKW
jgi:hypothetical protein